MKKRLICLLLCSALVLATSSCGKTSKEEELLAQIEQLQSQVNDMQGGSNDSNNTSNDNGSSAEEIDAATTDSDEDNQEEELEFTSFTKGDKISTDLVEITVNRISTTKKLTPSNTSGVYSYYEADSGKTFIYLYGDIKNIGKEAIDCERMYIKYEFDSGYTYSGQFVLERSGKLETFGYLDPLESAKFYIFGDVPDELIGKDEVLNAKISFNDFTDNRYSLNGTESNRFVIRVKV